MLNVMKKMLNGLKKIYTVFNNVQSGWACFYALKKVIIW